MAQPKHECKTCSYYKPDKGGGYALDECTYPYFRQKVDPSYHYWYCFVARNSENLCKGKMWVRKPGIGRKSTKVSKRKAA